MVALDDSGRSAPSDTPTTPLSQDLLLTILHPHTRDHVAQALADGHLLVLQFRRPLESLVGQLKDQPSRAPLPPTFRKRGRVWQFAFEGKEFFLPALQGFSYMHYLLSRPGEDIDAHDLIHDTREGYGQPRVKKKAAWDLGLNESGDLGQLADPQALRAARGRLAELEEQIEQAERRADTGALEALSHEKSQFVRYLAETTGLQGKPRRAGSQAERARQSCRAAIKAAIAAIERDSPALAAHLRLSIRTGFFCRYQPQEPVIRQL